MQHFSLLARGLSWSILWLLENPRSTQFVYFRGKDYVEGKLVKRHCFLCWIPLCLSLHFLPLPAYSARGTWDVAGKFSSPWAVLNSWRWGSRLVGFFGCAPLLEAGVCHCLASNLLEMACVTLRWARLGNSCSAGSWYASKLLRRFKPSWLLGRSWMFSLCGSVSLYLVCLQT